MKAEFQKHILIFKRPSGTSRGVLNTKETYFLVLKNEESFGVGECGLLRGLSIDDLPEYEEELKGVCENIDLGVNEANLYEALQEFPSIQFGLETAFKSLNSKNPFEIFSSEFTRGEASIPINGLVWMGDKVFMKEQISEKLKQGFTCIKMKIGAIDFKTELELLKSIRKEFSASEVELRADANGAFSPKEALEKLKVLSDLQLHSIEQPIKQGQWQEMARLCEETPLAIALDEELIGVFSEEEKNNLLNTIKPQFIILKPSLIGGFRGSDRWINLAEKHNAGWWITSALESNVGLSAISQYTFTKNSKLPQGLGTGSLYTNNIESPLRVSNGALHYNQNANWNFQF
ncbi:enolase superfamily enzyme related to L-alanine-DL-glutamate epimerase [Aequorivita sublithincola DSM 14238]|uniref:Enolase superfamily enzyme related to L-alanine-DL-glutamate epimerase n=1 Tax=Aequorivita sublithincola (strain DSM 14238 / LMG 21431 / ACAM 643 / 9-3) TaxID=746697 RepID=I3YXU4_AEQSU|nr:o-succinylbenzoate synthase [Aequorivita sublithincola]AFL81812.1 enolase superfamily enzyme related to L-alanine-DL-glutamate epimerase [Aequorivita sublithincola DSM 14238]